MCSTSVLLLQGARTKYQSHTYFGNISGWCGLTASVVNDIITSDFYETD